MPFGYEKFDEELQRIRNSLVHLDVMALDPRFRDYVKSSKALTMVWMCAAVETFWKAYLGELCARVNAASALKRRKNLPIASIFFFDTLASFGEGKRLRRWERAADFFSNFPSGGWPPSVIPYDGRTVRPEHVAVVWRIFGLKGPDFPSPIHKQELNTLADQRNDVAHGLIEPGVIGGTVTVDDLSRRVGRLEDFAIHCILAADNKWP